jgi:hypothetical protein
LVLNPAIAGTVIANWQGEKKGLGEGPRKKLARLGLRMCMHRDTPIVSVKIVNIQPFKETDSSNQVFMLPIA